MDVEHHTCLKIIVIVSEQNEDGVDRVHANDRLTVRNTIVGLMLKSPDKIQKQVNLFLKFKINIMEDWTDVIHTTVVSSCDVKN